MIYVDLNAELKNRIDTLESQLLNLHAGGSDPASSSVQATARDLHRCQRWLALLGGPERRGRSMPAPASTAIVTAAAGAVHIDRSGSKLPQVPVAASLRTKLSVPMIGA